VPWAAPLAGLSEIGAVTAYGQIDTRSQYGGTTAATCISFEPGPSSAATAQLPSI
jgi:hypothetical protein